LSHQYRQRGDAVNTSQTTQEAEEVIQLDDVILTPDTSEDTADDTVVEIPEDKLYCSFNYKLVNKCKFPLNIDPLSHPILTHSEMIVIQNVEVKRVFLT
jgi:hypothetical protein